MPKAISSLAVNAKVRDPNTLYYGQPIVFQIKAKNHPGYPSNSVTLITEKILTLKAVDAKEPGNSDPRRREYGNNRYSVSNIRQWLNSEATAGAWYSAQHSADAAPSSTGPAEYNPYAAQAGFLNGFSANMRAAMLTASLTVVKTDAWDGGGTETVRDRVFLASCTEVGLANERGIAEGTLLAGFSDNASRLAYPTPQAAANNTYASANPAADRPWQWWLRTPDTSNSYPVRLVYTNGALHQDNAFTGIWGVRPLCNLKSDTLVSDSPDGEGVYTIIWNRPPTIPPRINLPDQIHGGQTVKIQWGASTDAEGNFSGYVLERSVNSGAWEQRYRGSLLEFTDSVVLGWQTVQYRVKAYDTAGAESGYISSAKKTVINNRAPAAPASVTIPAQIFGGTNITVSWPRATDPDNNLTGYTLEQSVSGGAWTVVGNTADLSKRVPVTFGWTSIRFRVRAYDSNGAVSAYTMSNTVSVVNNRAPAAPAAVTIPQQIFGGTNITVSWSRAADADNNLVGYTVEQKIGGGAWAEIKNTKELSVQVPITFGWASVQFRVRAYDSYGAVSAYTQSNTVSIVNNHAPAISDSDRNLGTFTDSFPPLPYTVDDEDGDQVEITVKLDGVTIKTFAAKLGEENLLQIAAEDWRKIANGSHSLAICASDRPLEAAGGKRTTRTLTFTKSVRSVSFRLADSLPADAMPGKCILNAQGAFPEGCKLCVEVCNNASDAVPVWEDITQKVLTGQKHFFSNKTKTAETWGISVRVSLERGTATGDCYIHSLRGYYA